MNRFPEAKIYHSELEFISECVLHYPDVETGGDFFGFWSKDGNPVIQYVIGPGDQTSRTGTSFFQDISYLRECGIVLHGQFALEHIGAWHSHHQMRLFNPSSGDVQTMRNARQKRFLISICNVEMESAISIGSFLFSQDDPNDYTPCSVFILPGISPIRDSLRKPTSGVTLLKESKQKKNHDSFYKTNQKTVSYTLRSLGTVEPSSIADSPDKPHFSENSFWSKREGHKYLKNVYDKLKGTDDLSHIEIKQLADNRPAISFDYNGIMFEIRFPEDFPKEIPEVVVISNLENNDKKFWQRKRTISTAISQIEAVQRTINSLGILDGNQKVIIRYQ